MEKAILVRENTQKILEQEQELILDELFRLQDIHNEGSSHSIGSSTDSLSEKSSSSSSSVEPQQSTTGEFII